jgi:16S rRNA (cytidine1402-2'-O)-methyltransferase
MPPSSETSSKSPPLRSVSGPALYVVATPIGNLEDITMRALNVLRSVDFVLCEDTRQTQKLMSRYNIDKELLSTHRFSEEKNASRVVRRIEAGESAAYVTDGGTPAVSDPGARIVERARAAGLPVIAVPGPSAVTTAMSVSGWEGGFVFAGFVDRQHAARLRQLETALHLPWATVLFESPARIAATLGDAAEVFGERPIFFAREMTKLFEEVIKAPAAEILATLGEEVKGEITLVLFPDPGGGADPMPPAADVKAAEKACLDMIAAGVKPMKAASITAGLTGIPKKTLLAILERRR